MKNSTKISIVALAFASLAGYAQTEPAHKFGRQFAPCGTTEYEALLQQKDPKRATTAQFEEWLAPKVAAVKAKRLMRRGVNELVTIPVVVHIIHDGDPVGQQENITQAQVMSQITVLNQDFRKMAGTPGHNTNPVGADVEIEFCLAQRDPNGLLTTGIVRHPIGNGNMTRPQIEILKTLTQWDPAKYLNIWVVKSMVTEDGMQLLGYAQFPSDSGLPGLDFSDIPFSANTDGVVMAYDAFGSSDLYPEGIYFPGKDKGHTLTHELGHFFGLRHIWGDGQFACTGNDFCNDTPLSADANSGCPSPGWDSCPQSPGQDMFQNYMDYTDDACQNIFTLDQKDRIQAVLENSPRRASLLTSDGCVPGVTFNNEGSMQILNINAQCNTWFEPQVKVLNTGSNAITALAIAYDVDGGTEQVTNWTGNIAVGQEMDIPLNIIGAGPGMHLMNARLQLVNGQPDAAPSNDIVQRSFTIADTYGTTAVRIRILHDIFPTETVWRLRNSLGNTVAMGQGAVPASGVQEVVANVTVNEGECYTFEITDQQGDGMCCNFGFGYYILETAEGWIIAEGGAFGSSETVRFRIANAMGQADLSAAGSINLYPNPAGSILNIAVPEGAAVPEAYIIYNNLGQVITSGKISTSIQVIDVSAFAQGVYLVKVDGKEGSKILRFIKD